jgi:hypothetical protein
MNQHQFEELLDWHADRLLGAPAPAAGELPAALPAEAGLSPEDKKLFAGLARLAERAQGALVEVDPRPAFVVGLKGRLLATAKTEAQPVGGAQQRKAWIAGVGGALLLASLGILGYKAARAGMGWRAASRAGHPEAAKAPPAS